jgi:hypothetical protein
MAMTAEQWIERFAGAVEGRPPSETEVERLLKLAAVAAHSSERIAAPLACYVAGREGLQLDDAIDLAERIGESDDGG